MRRSIRLWHLAAPIGQFWIQAAGFSGFTAICLGAYGSCRKYNAEKGQSRTKFEVANRFHFFTSIALIGVPLCNDPIFTGFFMMTGTIMFSGSCYYQAFTGRNLHLAIPGGILMAIGWLSLMFY